MPWWTMLVAGCGGAPVTVTLSDAPTNRASALVIIGGAVDTQAVSAYEASCGPGGGPRPKGASPCVDHHFYVAPIRAPGDTTGPVHAWVTCPGEVTSAAACAAWLDAHPSTSGRVMWRHRPDRASGWQKAIGASGLPSIERAPVLLPASAEP